MPINQLPGDHPPTHPAHHSGQPAHTSHHTPSTPPKKQRSGWHDLFSTLGILAAAGAIALFLIFFVFRSYQVDGPSMANTLHNSDKLIIWKVPRTWASITGHDYIPKRGDIVVFNEPGMDSTGKDKQLIKRVIGLPGDRVVIKDSTLTVYNKENPQGFNPDLTLPYGKEHSFPETTGNVDTTLRADQIFVMGDNRVESLDSRTFGAVNANQIVGKLVLRIFPIGQAEAF